jgi:hypothetical protein
VSGEAERAAAVRAEQDADERAALHELIVVRLSEAMDDHSDSWGTGRCDCGYVEPHGLGIGLHQLEAAAWAVMDLVPEATT